MANKTFSPFDDVNGVIIGGDYGRAWVTYEGRKQGRVCYPQTEIEAWQMCDSVVENIKKEYGEAFDMIYPDSSAWKYHFDNI